MRALIGSGIIATMAAIFCIWLLRPLAVQVGFVDHPGGRKQHDQDVPLIGGIAIFFGFCFALLSLPISLQGYRGLIAGGSVLLVMGIVDDFRELSSTLRLLGQLGAGLILALWGDQQVEHLGNLFSLGNIDLGNWSVPFTVLSVMAFLNAMNMVDGQDGLAGGVALGQAGLLAYLSWLLNKPMALYLLIILVSLLIVFLFFNMRLPWRKQASIFMGDAGSTFVAFIIAWFSVSIGQTETVVVKPVVILWILAFPIFDLIHVCMIRIIHRKSILLASRDHFHHILSVAGFDAAISTPILVVLSIALGIVGIILNNLSVPEFWQLLTWIIALACYLIIVKLVRESIG